MFLFYVELNIVVIWEKSFHTWAELQQFRSVVKIHQVTNCNNCNTKSQANGKK